LMVVANIYDWAWGGVSAFPYPIRYKLYWGTFLPRFSPDFGNLPMPDLAEVPYSGLIFYSIIKPKASGTSSNVTKTGWASPMQKSILIRKLGQWYRRRANGPATSLASPGGGGLPIACVNPANDRQGTGAMPGLSQGIPCSKLSARNRSAMRRCMGGKVSLSVQPDMPELQMRVSSALFSTRSSTTTTNPAPTGQMITK